MKTVTINTRVSPELKQDVEKILSSLGLTTSQAITMYLQQIRMRNGIPFAVEVPEKSPLLLSLADQIITENEVALKELAK